jgi:hypothetical protein
VRPSQLSAACTIFVRDRLQLEVLGTEGGSKLWLYARRYRRVCTCSIESVNAVRLSSLAGLPVQQMLERAHLSVSDVQEHLAQASTRRSLEGYRPRGAGIYRDDDQLLILSGNQACRWDGRQQTPITSPLYKKYILEFNQAFELIPHLNDVLSEAAALTGTQGRVIWNDLVDLIKQWRWVEPSAATWLAGQILATILQSTWTWKAHTYLCAKRNTGKSTFLEMLAELLHPMVHLFSGDTTEAAIRQSLGHRSQYLFLDEFERNTEREKILRLLRPANHGGMVAKGSPSGHAQTFSVTQLAWLASIDRPGESAADSSRYLTFELDSITAAQKAVALPSRVQLARMRRNLYRLAFKYFRQFWQSADTLKAVHDTGLDGRMLDAIAVPCGIWATVGGVNPVALLQETASLWRPMLDDQIIDDEFVLLRAILQVKFKMGPEWRTIGNALVQDYAFQDLEAYGVKRTFTQQRMDIAAFSPDAVRRYCLAGTKWAPLNIRDLLLRLPGATATRLRMAGMDNARVVVIPMRTIYEMQA